MNLFAALNATWPPVRTFREGPFTLREGAGGGSRVSAATLDGALGDPGSAEAAMRAMGQRPLFMIRPGEDALDVTLAARGYSVLDPTVVMVAPVSALAAVGAGDAAIIGDAPLASMVGIWAAGGVGEARMAVMARAAGPMAWLLGRVGDRPSGAGFAACAGEVAMLHAVEVVEAARRQGLGAQLTLTAGAWARAQGARTFALAVTEANAPARALYAGLGLAEVTGYHYRIAPETQPVEPA